MSDFDSIMAKAGFNRVDSQAQAQAAPAPVTPDGAPAPAAPASDGSQQGQQGQAAAPAPEGAASQTDWNDIEPKFFSERLNGRFKSVAEVIDVADNYSKLQKEHTELTERSKGLFKPANDFVRDFNEAASKGIPMETFLTVQQIDQEKNPIAIVALANQIKFGLSSDDALWKAQRQYAATMANSEDRDFDADAKREASIQLNIDAAESKKFLEQYKSTAMKPVIETPEMIQSRARERSASWAPEIQKMKGDFTKLSFTTNVDKVDYNFDFNVPHETLAAAEKFVTEEFLADPTVEAIAGQDSEIVKDIFRGEIIKNCLPQIIEKVTMDAIAAERKRELEKKHNPSGARQEQPFIPGQAGVDKDRELANRFLSSFPINK